MNELIRRRDMMVDDGYKVMWNQLVKNGNFSQGTLNWRADCPFVSVSDNTYTLQQEEGGQYGCLQRIDYLSDKNIVLFEAKIKSSIGGGIIDTNAVLGWSYTYRDYWQLCSRIFKANKTIYFLVRNRNLNETYVQNVRSFDLTYMFGAGNEPSTVEQFNTWLTENGIDPESFFPYDAGTPRKMTKPSWIL